MSVEPNSDEMTRAEIASLDRIRDVSVGLQDLSKPRARDSVPVRGIHFANFIFKGTLWQSLRKTAVTFQTFRHLANIGCAQSGSIG
jgi:hypothetical protein